MDLHNFWYWLLTGLQDYILFFKGELPIYAPIGMGPLVYNFLVATLAPIMFYVGSFFNLCWFMLFMAIMAASETARATLALYRTVVKAIPLP